MAMENMFIAQHRDTLRYDAFAMVLTDLSCGDSSKGIMFISNVRRLQHWISGRGALCFG